MGDRAAAKLNNKFSRQNAALGAETRDAASRGSAGRRARVPNIIATGPSSCET
jgi:hypothetical protein